MTLDVYADLFDDDLEAVAARLDEIAQTADRGHSAELFADCAGHSGGWRAGRNALTCEFPGGDEGT
jgi:hypothetical protein